jgi:hypothetical protein
MENVNINNMPIPESPEPHSADDQVQGSNKQSERSQGMSDKETKDASMLIVAVVLVGLIVLGSIIFLPISPKHSEQVNSLPPPADSLPSTPILAIFPLSEGDSVSDIESDLDSLNLEDFEEDFNEVEIEIDQL